MNLFRLFLLLVTANAFAFDLEVGYQSAYGFNEDGFTRNMPYVQVGHCYDITPCQTFEGSLRLSGDIEKERGRMDVRFLSYEYLGEVTQLKIGVQQIPWGETFGFFIADIVNPRDYSDPIFNEIEWIRRGVFAINFQYLPDPFCFQFVVTPIPLNNILPKKGDPFYIVPEVLSTAPLLPRQSFDIDNFPDDAEYGVRVGYLMDCGVDLTTFYYHHFSRDPVLELTAENALKPITEKIDTVGGSISQAFDDWVLRGDCVVHLQTPFCWPQFGQVARLDLVRAIVGVDRTFDDEWCAGVQYHGDFWEGASLHSSSVQVSKGFCDGRHLIECFLYKGLNNRDLWIQPKYTLYFGCGLSISLRADFVFGTTKRGNPRDGVVGRFRNKDRIFLWLNYQPN